MMKCIYIYKPFYQNEEGDQIVNIEHKMMWLKKL